MSKRLTRVMLLSLALSFFPACSASAGANHSRLALMPDPASSVAAESGTTAETAAPKENAATSILVAYFSCTGTTRTLARYASELLDANLYELTPLVPYSYYDLDYSNSSSRASTEQNSPGARPRIAGSVKHMEKYDVILLAYPIWWGRAPRIIRTFLESDDFSGKTILPLCTSASSGIGSSAESLKALCSDTAAWKPGERFSSNTTKADIGQWLKKSGF